MRVIRIPALVTMLALSGVATAQTTSPIDRGRVDREQPGAPPPIETETPVSSTATRIDATISAETAPPIQGISFEGTQVPTIVGRAAQSFIGQPATTANLQALVAAMSTAYGKSEVALFTIVIPEQDLSAGHVRILIAEGFVEAVILTGEVDGRKLKLVKAYADKLTREKPTSKRVLERYLSLMRDIPGLKITPSMQTGENNGAVRLIISLDHQRTNFSTGFNNRTTRVVKDGQFQASTKFYSLLRDGDLTDFTVSAAVNFKDSNYAGLSHSTPIGTDGMRLTLNGAIINTKPHKSNIKGKARTFGATLSYPIIRSYKRNMTLSAAFDGLNSDNAAFGSLIASERTRALRSAVGFSDVSSKRSISGGLTLSKGFDILGARTNILQSQTKFSKVNGRVGIDQLIGKQMVLRVRASGQYSQNRLPTSELYSVGGPDFGRAFEVGIISSDSGYAGLAEFAVRPIKKGDFANSEIYGFLDGGKVTINARGPFAKQSYSLASAGGGIRFGWKEKAWIELEAARVIDKPFPNYDHKWRFSVAWRLSLRQ